MAVWLRSSYREGGIQQEYTLFCPALQVAMTRNRGSYIFMQFFKNIDERRRRLYTTRNGECQSLRLAMTVIRILTQQNQFYFIKWSSFKGVKDQLARWINGLAQCFFCFQKSYDLFEIILLKFFLQYILPTGFDLYVHYDTNSSLFVLWYSSISFRCNSKGTGEYSAKLILNFARPCVMERSEEE